MSETTPLLHNMSAPPKSVVAYAGLGREAKSYVPKNTDMRPGGHRSHGVFGTFITFRLPQTLRYCEPEEIPKLFNLETIGRPVTALLKLIDKRAKELLLPDACVVVPANPVHFRPWPDPLAAIAVITKSSNNVWLRHKTPLFSKLRKRDAVSLLVPPAFAKRIEELKV